MRHLVIVWLLGCGRTGLDLEPGDATPADVSQEAGCGAPTREEAIAHLTSNAIHLVATSSFVYFKADVIESGPGVAWDVRRVGKCGGGVETLVRASGSGLRDAWPERAAGIVGSHEYFGATTGVVRRPLAGGASERFTDLSQQFLLAGDAVFVTPMGGGVFALPVAGGINALDPDGRLELVDDAHVFFTRSTNAIWVATLQGAGRRELLPADPAPADHLVSDGVQLYFRRVRFEPPSQRTPTPLMRVRVDGSAPPVAVTGVPWRWSSIAVRDGFVYGHDDRQVVRVARDGGDVEVVATLGTETLQLEDVTFGEDGLYWILDERRFGGGGSIWRAPTP